MSLFNLYSGSSWSLVFLCKKKINHFYCQLLYTAVSVSAVQQSKSAIHIHISSLVCISFPCRSPQSTKLGSLLHAVGSHQLSNLYIVVNICQCHSPNSSYPTPVPCQYPYICSLCPRDLFHNRSCTSIHLNMVKMSNLSYMFLTTVKEIVTSFRWSGFL